MEQTVEVEVDDLDSVGSTKPKKKKTSKKKQLEQTVEVEVDDLLETCDII